ncbi:polyketide synthase dehydratase domain-containing protein, partial [Streptomyces sp. M2CJ-2]|uniref:polyketide synthase dehydratase domain-containing protein n=1 Tax=Streptomyces sp. M2CJ-2 TaxID=2803948 RepID=UPI0034D502C0
MQVPAEGLTAWPPPGAEPVELGDAYGETLPDLGFAYGPAFRGLRGVWRRGEELFAEVATPEEAGIDPKPFGLHPALLDAALHAQLLTADDAAPALPFVWSDVSLLAAGATVLRVRMAPADGDGVSLEVADGEGQPVAYVGSLVTRPLGEPAGSASGAGELYGVEWAEWTGSSSGAGGSAVVVGGAL